MAPSRTTFTPAPRRSGEAAQRTAARRFDGPSSFGSDGARIAPTTITGSGRSRTRSHRNAVSSITSVPWTTTTPSMAGSSWQRRISLAISNSLGNEK
jgi:hypothetical protein